MPDKLDFQITVGANITITVPRITVAARVVDSKIQKTIMADFTGANTFEVWQALRDLNAAQKRSVMGALIERLIDIRAGIDDGL